MKKRGQHKAIPQVVIIKTIAILVALDARIL